MELLSWLREEKSIPNLRCGDLLYIVENVPTNFLFSETFLEILSKTERAKLQRFQYEQDRNAFLMAHVLKRLVLSKFTGIPSKKLIFVKEKKGKPKLQNSPYFFNISHTKGFVALAISVGRSIGVDVETCHSKDINLLSPRVLCEKEHKSCMNAKNPDEQFIQYWVEKEAASKAWGDGLTIPFNKICNIKNIKGWSLYEYGSKNAAVKTHSLVGAKLAVAMSCKPPSHSYFIQNGMRPAIAHKTK